MKKYSEILLYVGMALLSFAMLVMMPLVILNVIPTGDTTAIIGELCAGIGILLMLFVCTD